jgi:hypothetical protein
VKIGWGKPRIGVWNVVGKSLSAHQLKHE